MSGRRHSILVEEAGTQRRRRVTVESVASGLHGFVITPWHTARENDHEKESFALTHAETGRLTHLNSKTLDEIQEFIRELKRCRIEPHNVHNAETAEHYFVQRLSQEALEMAQ